MYGVGRVGRVGSIGGDSSFSGTLAVLGGVLKGESLSGLNCADLGSSLGALSPTIDRRVLGLSARLTGGGTTDEVFASRSRLSSTDLRGGGGEGGCGEVSRGDERRVSRPGVVGRLGILNGRDGGVTGVGGALVGSGFRRAAASTAGWDRALLIGGE